MRRFQLAAAALFACIFIPGCGTAELRDFIEAARRASARSPPLSPVASPGEFQGFSSTAGHFQVQLPGKPIEESKAVPGTVMKMFTVTEPGHEYAVAYADMPMTRHESEAAVEKRLNGAAVGMVRS